MKIGDRVGAIASIEDNIAYFYGYGTYEGMVIPNHDKNRYTMADFNRDNKTKNHLIKLDDGGIVYGCECWWGTRDKIRERLSNCEEVRMVSINEELKELEELNNG